MTAELPVALPAIRIWNLVKRYGSLEAVRSIGFDVEAGEIFGVIGPDGAGKTSIWTVSAIGSPANSAAA